MCREVAKKFMALLLSVCMIAGMVDWSGLAVVHAAELDSFDEVRVKAGETFTYTGEQINIEASQVEVYLMGQDVPIDAADSSGEANYEIINGTNENVADGGTFTVVGKGAYEGEEITGTFPILPKNISSPGVVTVDGGEDRFIVGTGTVEASSVTVTDVVRNKSLQGVREDGGRHPEADYTFDFSGNKVDETSPDEITATITVKGVNNYEGTATGSYTIHRRKNSEFTIEWAKGTLSADPAGGSKQLRTEAYDINGNPAVFDNTDVVVKYGTKTLDEDQFALEIEGNSGGATTDGKVYARGVKDGYEGLRTEEPAPFRILKSLSQMDKYNKKWTINIKPQRYTGNRIVPPKSDVTIVDPDGGEVKPEEWDFEPNSGKNDINDGTATIEIRGVTSISGQRTRYTGKCEAEFQIQASRLTEEIVHLDELDYTYDGVTDFYDKIEDDLKIYEGSDENNNKIEYENNVDYTITKVGNLKAINAGKRYGITIARTPDSRLVGGPITVYFEVKQKNINDKEITFSYLPWQGESYYSNIDGNGYTYTGSRIQATLDIKYNRGTNGTLDVKQGTDYSLSWGANTEAGGDNAGSITISAQGNYTGSRPVYFKIKPLDIERAKNEGKLHFKLAQDEYPYSGKPIEPKFNLNVDNYPAMVKGKDYSIDYNDADHTNVNPNVTFTIRGSGNYKGAISESFAIIEQTITDNNVTVTIGGDLTYNKQNIVPEVTVMHSENGLLQNEKDYRLEFPAESKLAGTYEFNIVGKTNYEGTIKKTYTIKRCDISTLKAGDGTTDGIDIFSMDAPSGREYHFLNGEPFGTREYNYTGNKVSPSIGIQIAVHGILTEGETEDYVVDYGDADSNRELGMGTMEVIGKNNYTGTRTITFAIKGSVTDTGRMKVEFPKQPYSAVKIVPKGAVASFDGIPLEEGKDFYVENRTEEDVTQVGGGHTAHVTGQGDKIFNTGQFPFIVRKFDLSKDIGKDPDNQFDIQMEQSHIYSGLSIKPKPVITHNGQNVTETQDYTLTYYKVVGDVETGKRGELIENPTDVGTYEVEITGTGANYEGTTSKRYTISPYDIGTGYTNKEILVEGVDGDVVLDTLKEASAQEGYAGNAQYNPTDGMVTWKDLALKHRLKDNDDEALQTKKPMVLATKETKGDYIATYTKNNTIGRAEIKIQAVNGGNYTGEFTVYFKIKGDLTKAEIEVKDWTYTPPKEAGGPETNCPIPTLVYKVEYGEEKTEIPLEEGTDYTLKWENNDKATKSDEDTLLDENLAPENIPFVKVIPTTAPEGDNWESKLGYYVNETGANFHIIQRDLGRTIESEGVEKDTELELGNFNLEKPEYEYTGSAIVPDINITCAGGQVVKKAGDDDTNYDYEVTAINNTDAFEWEGEVGVGEPLKPLMTVAAKQVDGKYTGNYKGSFTCNFTVTPRQISKETIDTTIPIVGVPEEVDYTGEDITFPIDDANPVVIMWYKEGLTEAVELRENQDYVFDYDAGNNTKIGKGELVIKGKEWSNYAGEYIKEFKIMASIEEVDKNDPVYMTLEYDENVPYGVTAVYPDLKFVDRSGYLCGDTEEPYHELVLGEDFEIIPEGGSPSENGKGTSRNNINVGTYDKENPDEEHNQDAPTIVVRGKNYYRGEIRRYYNITPKDLKDESITVRYPEALTLEGYENAFVYTGNEITPRIEVYNGTNLMETPRDYTITGYDNNTNLSTETNKAKITIAATEGGNYIGEQTFEFDIVPQPIEEMQVTIANENAIYYDRKAKQPEISVFYRDNGKRVDLTEGTDYTVDYGNYVDAAKKDEEDESKRPTIILRGIGGYGGEKRVTYTILPENIANEEDIEVTGRLLYTGGSGPFKPVFTVKAKDGTVLREVTEENGAGDYTVAEYTGTPTIGGEGTTTITGVGNYTGTRSVKFRIIPPEGTIQIAEIPDESYNSMPHNPEVKVSLLVEKENISIDLVEGTDYEVSYSNNINAGTATVTVKGIGDFANQRPAVKNFTITKRGIGTGLALMDYMAFTPIPDQQYTGRGITPQAQLVYRDVYENSAGTQENIERTLVAGNDYVVSYSNNVAVGTATATITGINNYSGSYRTTFRIYGNMNMATVAEIPTQEYTGSPVTPVPDVSFGGKKLTEGTDYTLEYKNNTERGTATIVITGLGQYTGTKTVTFTIAKELSDSTSVKGVAAAYTYTGSAIKPPVRVEDNGTVLTNGRDYQVSYKDNVNAGTATITITGMDKYRGSKTVTFKISPQQLGRATVAKIGDKTYTGKDMKPSIKVTSGNVTLKNNTDYTVVYVGGKTPGRASVIIKGAGNFTGTQTVSYNITVPKMSGAKVSKYTKDSLTFSWKKNNVVSGYEIYNSKNRREKKITKKTTVKGTVSKLSAGKSYTFRIRAYVSKSGKYYYGPFTTIKTATAPKSTKISKLTSSKKKQVTVKWNKVSGATQYEIYRSTSKKGKYTKIGTSKKTSYTDKKATGGKKYYYKVRVCKTISKKNYYSSYSSVKSVKAKK